MLILASLHSWVHWPTQGGYNFISGPLADITLCRTGVVGVVQGGVVHRDDLGLFAGVRAAAATPA